MMPSGTDGRLDDCHCCEVPEAEAIHNRPGLPALCYRAGTWATFVESMKQSLAGQPALAALTTRAPDDPAMALLDAWAVVGDILTFYQERIANEGYLRTATERRSVQELARAIGYELGPGVAASTYLAFTVDQPLVPNAALPMPTTITVPTGTKVQSVPRASQLPQTFETTEELDARVAWNQMLPKSTQRQRLQVSSGVLERLDATSGAASAAGSIWLNGTGTNLRVGDCVLVQVGDDNLQPGDAVTPLAGELCLYVTAVTPDYAAKRTEVELWQDGADDPPFSIAPAPAEGVVDLTLIELTPDNVRAQILDQHWTEENLSAYIAVQGWDPDAVLTQVSSLLAADPLPASVWAFRTRSGVFGHAAPNFKGIEKAWNDAPPWEDWDDKSEPITVWTDSDGVPYSDDHKADLFLDRVVHGVAKRGWVALVVSTPTADEPPLPFAITKVIEASLSDFAISGKCTGVKILEDDTDVEVDPYSAFTMRRTTVFSQSEALDVCEVPVDEVIPATTGPAQITLDRMVLGFYEDQVVSLSGTTVDPTTGESSGQTAAEILTVDYAEHTRGYTTVTFKEGLANGYVRSTVSLCGNVVPATHGATTANEILGSGDGSQKRQSFVLKVPPLTYVAATTPTGGESTLTVRVAGVEWTELDSLYPAGPTDRVFVSRQQPDGTTAVIFGDGVRGARLPTGRNNVTATYRSGTGVDGQLGAGRITLLQSKPLGVKAASNPVEASGAADQEKMSGARANAPRTVRTLDRLVSLYDFEDFARCYLGIGKAQATPIWSGEQLKVHLTLGDALGAPVDPADTLGLNLKESIVGASDGRHAVEIDGYVARFFYLTLDVIVDPTYLDTKVRKAVKAALRAAFAYDMREIGQSVTEAEIMAITQAVPGVVATDLSALYDASDAAPSMTGVLQAFGAHFDGTDIVAGELVLLHPVGLTVTASYA